MFSSTVAAHLGVLLPALACSACTGVSTSSGDGTDGAGGMTTDSGSGGTSRGSGGGAPATGAHSGASGTTPSDSGAPDATPSDSGAKGDGGSPRCTGTANGPDGPDGNGGCWPGPDSTGPDEPESSMAAYSGPCTITAANTMIDSRVINCKPLVVKGSASGLVISNSYLKGGIVQSGGAASFTLQDSFMDNAVSYPACSDGSCPAGLYACGDPNNATTECGVTGSNFTVRRTEIIDTNRAAYCVSNCTIEDNYFHGTNLWPDKTNLAHASSARVEQNVTLRHNTLWCSFEGPFANDEIGCSADITGYPDFVPIKNNTIDRNLLMANNAGIGFCAYGGGTKGKPFSGDATNATNIVFTNNVFQGGANKKCGAYGPVTDFVTGRTGNVWTNNKWDNGAFVPPG
jgi:hypothetical protein